jgi:hypothetical protein
MARPLTGTEKKEVKSIRVAPSVEKKIIKKYGSLQAYVDAFEKKEEYLYVFLHLDADNEVLAKKPFRTKEEALAWVARNYLSTFTSSENLEALASGREITDTSDESYRIYKSKKRGKK